MLTTPKRTQKGLGQRTSDVDIGSYVTEYVRILLLGGYWKLYDGIRKSFRGVLEAM